MRFNCYKKIPAQKSLSILQNQCAKTELCIFDIQKKLQRWQVDAVNIEQITKSLLAQNFVNEKRFARAYALDNLRFRKWGKYKIKMKLSSRKIKTVDIEHALKAIDDEEYYEILSSLIKHKSQNIKETDKYKKRVKLLNFIRSRGFELSLAQSIIAEKVDF